jgi:REP element-mobilizing transposase RayT
MLTPAPLAYHLTWTAYGTWLHGDTRWWVESGVPGVQPPDERRVLDSESRMVQTAVTFDEAQRALVEQVIREHCQIRGWHLHALNARSNHVHVVVTADREPEEVMNQLKAWCSRRLSDAAGLNSPPGAKKAGRKKWFTEHGSTKWINDEVYLENAVRYVLDGQ